MRSTMQNIDTYEILMHQHTRMLHAYVLGIVGDSADIADDVVQDTFVSAYRNLSALRDKTAFAPWIRTIARNKALNMLKRAGREFLVDSNTIQGMEDIFGQLDNDSYGEQWEERLKIVQNCFGELPDLLRQACELYYMEDQSTKNIAAKLSASLASILKRLERGRILLRECVEQHMAFEDA